MSTFLLIIAIICALGAVASLLTGVIGMSGRAFNQKYGNKLMRARVAAYGTVDEFNSVLGLARLHLAGDAEADAMLGRIQNDLFDLGADLCTPEREKPKWPPLR